MADCPTKTDAPTLLAIVVAARKTGDRALERSARHLLLTEHGIDVTIRRPPTPEQKGVSRAQ
jgi:hypothetical protein